MTFSTKSETLLNLPFVDEIIDKYNGQIYLVGGAVRDDILGKTFKDLDILITGIPLDILEHALDKYGEVNAVGKSFGIFKLKPIDGSDEIDIAIPRTEKVTDEGGHKAFDVVSDHNLSIIDDLRRRDFTINAIAKGINGELIDPFGGKSDLDNKIIRVVNPEAFSDDPLRMLRAVQFASRFNFKIESKTLKMIKNNAYKIKEISPERILIEFDKIVKKGNKLTGALYLKETNLLNNILNTDVDIEIESKWDNVKTMGEFIFLLMYNTISDISKFYKDELKGNSETYKEIKALEIGLNENMDSPFKNRGIAHVMYKHSPNSLNSEILPDNLQKAAMELLSGKYPKTINELEINGNDLIELGFRGEEIGNKFKSLLSNVYHENVKNNREDLLNLLGK